MCPKRIEEDHKDFRDIYSGRIRKELRKYINNGSITRFRGKKGFINITIPKIDVPHIVYGSNPSGVGRGSGKPGDVIDKDGKKGKNGRQPGDQEGEGTVISIDMEEVLKFLQEDLELPDLKPKPNPTFEEIKIKYNNVALNGPESLRHMRRTMLQALKRNCATGEALKLHKIPGQEQPVRLIMPISADKRYRQYREIKIPSSNAVIFFARDGSGSMDQVKCDIVSDIAWWVDLWIRSFYKRVERRYIWHDVTAHEIDEQNFYRYRYGGGTVCTSALKEILRQFDQSFPPEKWNIYIFYFTDGENWDRDNKLFCEIIEQHMGPEVVNLIGITEILPWGSDTLKKYVDANCKSENLRTTAISGDPSSGNGWWSPGISDESADQQKRQAIIDLLGKGKNGSGKKTAVKEEVA